VYKFLLYLRCHHIIGCCKTHVLHGLNISYPNTHCVMENVKGPTFAQLLPFLFFLKKQNKKNEKKCLNQ
jgi:hypothetical protein